MDTIYLKLAGFILKITFSPTYSPTVKKKLIRSISRYLKGYIVTTDILKIDFTINFIEIININLLINKTKTYEEKYMSFYKSSYNIITTYYYISFTQILILFKEVLHYLLNKNIGFQLHCSSIIINNKAILFVGKHTAGKSTIIKLLRGRFTPFADDNIAIKKTTGGFFAYQTFDYEKNNIPTSVNGYPVSTVYFIHKSQKTYKKNILNKNIIIKLLLKECWISDNTVKDIQYKTIFSFIDSSIAFRYLYFQKKHNELLTFMKQTHDETPELA